MTGGSARTRWRAFADLVAAALGINVWVSVALLRGFSWASVSPLAALCAGIPVLALAAGLWRRNEVVLLLGFPLALLVPAGVYPDIVEPHVYGPVRFTVVAISLVGYLLGASFLSSFSEPPPPERVRPLASAAQPVAARWRRRFRVYAGLTALSVVFPAALIYAVNFDRANGAFLRELYPGKSHPFQTLLNLGALGLWLALYSGVFLGALRPHRTGDQDLSDSLAMLADEARRGKPRPAFYVGVALALALMTALIALRYG